MTETKMTIKDALDIFSKTATLLEKRIKEVEQQSLDIIVWSNEVKDWSVIVMNSLKELGSKQKVNTLERTNELLKSGSQKLHSLNNVLSLENSRLKFQVSSKQRTIKSLQERLDITDKAFMTTARKLVEVGQRNKDNEKHKTKSRQ